MKGELVLKYLDQSGISLCLPPAYCWTRKGRANQHRVRTRWGKQGRINLIGTLSWDGEEVESLEYRMLEGPCRTGEEVLGYLDASLAEEAGGRRRDESVVVVLDNASSFHTAGAVREREPGWAARGLSRTVPPTGVLCPHLLNPIEGVCRRLKGFLMPRRFYDSLWPNSSRPSCTPYAYWEPWSFSVGLEVLR